ncbi:hypothetical protein TWF730_003311 [Orbilia blumenaviensis]|uniref:Uncharacterized protein n=1 Tax=Orbilia blumenaviensis TaxID=1796055 RepID=A0AAV9U9C9_9PEZI
MKSDPRKPPSLKFVLQDGIPKGFRYAHGTLNTEGNMTPGPTVHDSPSTVLSGDILDLIFLDEPLFSPYQTDPLMASLFSDGETSKEIFRRRWQKFIKTEVIDGITYQGGSYYYYETGEDGETAKLGARVKNIGPWPKSNKFALRVGVEIIYGDNWISGFWGAELNPRRETSIREILETILTEIAPILRKWGIKAEILHEIFLYGFQNGDLGWYLVTEITVEPGSGYQYLRELTSN